MRAVKPVLAMLLVGGLAYLWSNRQPVLDAYRVDESGTALQLSGIDLDRGLTDVGPSPFALPVAEDGRHRAPALTPVTAPEAPTTVSLGGGTGALSGSVTGPAGPVAGATVRIERHTTDGRGAREITTGPDGLWSTGGLPGGRYRVRAWAPGGLTMDRSQVLYLVAGGRRGGMDLTLAPISPQTRAAFTTRGVVYLGLTATVAVSLTTERVGADGVVEVVPVAGGPVSLPSVAGFTVTPSSTVTDGQGVARFTVRCHRLGTGSTTMTHNQWRGTVTLPTCVDRSQAPPPPAEGETAVVPPLTQQPITLVGPPPGPAPTTDPVGSPGGNPGSVANARPSSSEAANG